MKTNHWTVTVRLTHSDAQELLHKLSSLAETPDLQADYGLTQTQADWLLNSAPITGAEWTVPDFGWEAVCAEMRDHCRVLRDIAQDARAAGKPGQAARIVAQADRLMRTFA